MTLIIAFIINCVLVPQHAYPVVGADCEEIRQLRTVRESWEEVFGKGVVLICKEMRK